MTSEEQRVTPEKDDVERVAAGYRASGYRVTYQPGADQLPSAIAAYRPDLLAERGNEHILVEVKRSARGPEDGRYRELVERVQGVPGWRLDLVVVGSPDLLPLSAGLPVLPALEAERRYEEARSLATQGHRDAALLIAWSATEATLRLLAERNAVLVQRSNTPMLLKQLVSMGILDRDQYELLWALYQQRNAVAHGFAADQAPDSAERVIGAGRQLLAELHKAA